MVVSTMTTLSSSGRQETGADLKACTVVEGLATMNLAPVIIKKAESSPSSTAENKVDGSKSRLTLETGCGQRSLAT